MKADELIETLTTVIDADEPEAVLDELSQEESFETPEDGLVVGIGGHGLASRYFRLWLVTEHLELNFVVPAFNAFGADWEGGIENMRTLCRLACLALSRDTWSEDAARIEARWNGFASDGCSWRLFSEAGETVREGDDWGALTDLLVEAPPSPDLVRFDV